MWSLPSAQYRATASPAEPRARSVPATEALTAHGGIPEPPTTFPELDALSVRELQALVQDRAKFEHFINTHAHTRAVEGALAPLRREVEALGDNEAVDSGTVEALERELETLREERAAWMARNTEFHLESRLVALIDEGERDSAQLVDEWRQGVVEYAEFMRKYVETRTRIAERKLKLDSFREKMQRAKHRR